MALLIIKSKERLMGRVYSTADCHCGVEIILQGMTTECDECGRQYNWHGMPLGPRSLWGEETGEHPCDVERIP